MHCNVWQQTHANHCQCKITSLWLATTCGLLNYIQQWGKSEGREETAFRQDDAHKLANSHVKVAGGMCCQVQLHRVLTSLYTATLLGCVYHDPVTFNLACSCDLPDVATPTFTNSYQTMGMCMCTCTCVQLVFACTQCHCMSDHSIYSSTLRSCNYNMQLHAYTMTVMTIRYINTSFKSNYNVPERRHCHFSVIHVWNLSESSEFIRV